MNVLTKRAVSIAATVMLLATLGATAGVPALAKQPDGKGKRPKATFGIVYYDVGYAGLPYDIFEATGAIQDKGSAEDFGTFFILELYGKHGDIFIVVDEENAKWKYLGDFTSSVRSTFEILGGTGRYADLAGQGSATGEFWHNYQGAMLWHLDGTVTAP